MFCPKCGSSMKDGAKFCPSCGEKVGAGEQALPCPQCGAELKPGAKFCPKCGCAVGAAAPPQQSGEPIIVPATVSDVSDLAETPAPSQGAGAPQGTPAKPKLGKKAVIGLVVALVAVVVVAGVALFASKGCSSAGGALPNEKAAIYAEHGKKSNAYLPLQDGSTLEIEGDITSARLTPDGKHVVVVEDDGDLYVMDSTGENKTAVNDDCGYIDTVLDDGLVYNTQDKNGDPIYYRYLFNPGDDQKGNYKLGAVDSISVADRSLSLAFIPDEDDDLYLLPQDTDVPVKVGNTPDRCVLLGVSDAGDTVVWNEYSSEDGTEYETIKCYENDEVAELCTFESKLQYHSGSYIGFGYYSSGYYDSPYNHSSAYFNSAGAYYVKNSEVESIVLKLPGREAVQADLSGTAFSIFTSRCNFSRDASSSIDGLYVLTLEDGDEYNGKLYFISAESGEKTKINSDVYSMAIANGTLAYTVGDSESNDLYVTTCAGAKTEEGEQIDDDACYLTLADSGRILYYAKDCDSDDDTADLCCYSLGDKDPVTIDSDVSTLSYSPFQLSANGKTIYYCSDVSRKSFTTGDLFSWSLGAQEPTRICADVLVSGAAFYDDLRFGVSSDTFYFHQNPHSGTVNYADYMVFRNGAVETVAEDVRFGGNGE